MKIIDFLHFNSSDKNIRKKEGGREKQKINISKYLVSK